jgi:predicted metal-dependent enzyme (double-stranded beta helix superfamily)
VAGVIHARGTVSEKVKVREPKNTEFVTQQVTIQPGGDTGWHTHPGAALVTVKSGTLTLTGLRHRGDDDDDHDRGGRRGRCETESFSAGQAFVDAGHGHVHIGRNLGTTPVELWVTFTGVPPGGAFRIDAADPGC